MRSIKRRVIKSERSSIASRTVIIRGGSNIIYGGSSVSVLILRAGIQVAINRLYDYFTQTIP